MSLTLVAVPIGNPQDIGLRALEILKNAEAIILEEFKESTQFLRAHGISGKEYLQLNEHTTPEELKDLMEHCRQKKIALITDAGTPGFCDPGADLVRLCRTNGVAVDSIPGASSLMTLLSHSSQRLDQFFFRGFLPAETEARELALKKLAKDPQAIVILDTPYRFGKTLKDLQKHFADRKVLIGINLTQADQKIWEGMTAKIAADQFPAKAEFILLIYPAKNA